MQIEHHFKQLTLSEFIDSYRDVDKFIVFCKECPAYDRTWVCPSFDTAPPLTEYRHITIIGSKIYHPSQSVESAEQMMIRGAEILAPIRERLDTKLRELEAHTPSSRALFAGSCRRCPMGECTRPYGKPCSKPDEARSSLEALGFDVGRTTSELLGIEIKWGTASSLPDYYTLVYGMLSMEPIRTEEIEKWLDKV